MTGSPLTSDEQALVDELREYAHVVIRHDVPIRAYRLDELADALEGALSRVDALEEALREIAEEAGSYEPTLAQMAREALRGEEGA